MEKRAVIEDMKSFAGASFITKKKFAEYMGLGDPKHTVRWLKGLDRVDGKYYFIPDIAEVLIGRSTQ